jgi:hypothetical protein
MGLFSFQIDRVFGIGVAILAFAFSLSFVFAFFCMKSSFPSSPNFVNRDVAHVEKISIPFSSSQQRALLPIPNMEGDLACFFDVPRPHCELLREDSCTVLLKKTGQQRKVSLPSRVDFYYDKGLAFGDSLGLFWADLESLGKSQVLARLFVSDPQGIVSEISSFVIPIEETPIRSAHDFSLESPFKALAEAHLLGRDLVLREYFGGEVSQRIELEAFKGEIVDLKIGDFLIWKEGKWSKASFPFDREVPFLAKVVGCDEKKLLFEGWGLDEYFRFSVSSTPQIPLKIKAEDFLSAVRVRSEKQISCMLDKQCFVLRVGDWALKEGNRWKVLRKTDEKEAYLKGQIVGELFVFDRLDSNGGQKSLHGTFFNDRRSQMIPFDICASSQRKHQTGQIRKGKLK